MGNRPIPPATPFRQLIAAKDSPSLGEFRRLGRRSGNCGEMGSRQPRFGPKRGRLRYRPIAHDSPDVTPKATPFRAMLAAIRSPDMGGCRRLGRMSVNSAKMGDPSPRLWSEIGRHGESGDRPRSWGIRGQSADVDGEPFARRDRGWRLPISAHLSGHHPRARNPPPPKSGESLAATRFRKGVARRIGRLSAT